MRQLTPQEKRTIRFASIGLALYLTLFYTPRLWNQLASGNSQQQALTLEIQSFKQELPPYENRLLRLEKLRNEIQLKPSPPNTPELIAETSAAIQNSAMSSGIKVGPLRETGSRPSAKELASMRLEALGPAPNLLQWIAQLELLGFPILIDSIQIDADPRQPNMLKASLSLLILDPRQWTKEDTRNA
jgi:hypothetical protein